MPLHRGKLATNHPEVIESRPLTREDLAVLLDKPRGPDPTRAGSGAIARLREPHHRLARMVAAGLRTQEIVERGGYSQGRLTTLMKDPAFQELVAGYREKVDAAFEREQEAFVELATRNMITAERMLMEKLEIADEDGTLPSIRELMSIRSDSADRLGYGKRNMNLNVNVDFAARMEQAIARSRGARTLEAQPVPVVASPAVSPPPAPSDPAAEARAVPPRVLRRA